MLPQTTNYTINLDKLELMLTQDQVTESSIFDSSSTTYFASLTPSIALQSYHSKGIVLNKIICTDPHYHLAYDIIINKETFGILLLNRTKFYESDNDLIKLRVSNSTLYTGFTPALNNFLKAFKFSINNITRLDIALDTNDDLIDKFYYYFRDEANYFLKGGNKKLESIDKFSREYRSQIENPTLYLGKKDKKLRIYNKSIEIDEKSQKDYITAFHKANGLDTDQEMYTA